MLLGTSDVPINNPWAHTALILHISNGSLKKFFFSGGEWQVDHS